MSDLVKEINERYALLNELERLRDAAQAEVERLARERDETRAEVEKLHKAHQAACEGGDLLRAENAPPPRANRRVFRRAGDASGGARGVTRHRPAPLVIRWYLRATGFQGITMPWGRAYYWPWPPADGLIAHEKVHLDQLHRLGPVRFTARYLWLLLRHGYERHPMEIEARERSGHR